MKRILLALLGLFCFAVTSVAGTIPVVGTIRNVDGSRFNGTVRMTLNYPATDATSGLLVSPTSVTIRVNNGTIATTQITPNDIMQPEKTFYVAQFFNSAGQMVRQNNFYVETPIAPATQFNLGTATPTTLTSSNISFATLGNSNSIINNRVFCYSGANFGAKFTAAALLLPSTGGIVDCSNLQGAQTNTSDVWAGQTKPILLIPPTGTWSSPVSITIPATMTIDFPEGGILSMAAATTATILGEVRGTLSQHFTGSGSVSFLGGATLSRTSVVYPQWWGAVGDAATDDTAAIYKTCQSAYNVFVPDGDYLVNNLTRHTDPVTGQSLPGACWPVSNSVITLSRRANLITRPYQAGDDCAGRVFGIYSVSNVTIRGGQITGNYSFPTTPAPRVAACPIGSNHGIEIGNSHDVTVQDMKVVNNWGDGWTVSAIGDLPGVSNSTNVQFLNVFASQNYRNGGSCVAWAGGAVVGGGYTETKGAGSPEAGIDIEPNGIGANLTQVCRNITIIHPYFLNNNGSDVQAINANTYGLTIDATGKIITQNIRGAKVMDSIGGTNEPGVTTTTYVGTGRASGDVLAKTQYYNSDTTDGNSVVVSIHGTRGAASLTGRYDIQTRDGATLATRLLIDHTAVQATVPIQVPTYTFAGKPSLNEGAIIGITDSPTLTNGATLTVGAGTGHVLAYQTNSALIVLGGK